MIKQKDNNSNKKNSFELETIKIFARCFQELNDIPHVIETSFTELWRNCMGFENVLSEQEIREDLQEWLNGFKETGNRNFQTKRSIASKKEIKKLFNKD